MGSVLQSSTCHYCTERKADTVDHLVPRAVLPKPYFYLPRWFRDQNEAPSCKQDNNLKAFYRSTCTCDQCTFVWNAALALFIPSGYRPRGPIQVPAPPPPDPPRILSTRAARERLALQDTHRARTVRALQAGRRWARERERESVESV